jgi:hypothetical protein
MRGDIVRVIAQRVPLHMVVIALMGCGGGESLTGAGGGPRLPLAGRYELSVSEMVVGAGPQDGSCRVERFGEYEIQTDATSGLFSGAGVLANGLSILCGAGDFISTANAYIYQGRVRGDSVTMLIGPGSTWEFVARGKAVGNAFQGVLSGATPPGPTQKPISGKFLLRPL